MSDFDKLYADAKKRHTGLFGVDHAAIRKEFERQWREDSERRDRQSKRQLVRASVIVVVLCIATISGLIWWGL
jgi:cytoskeletal protein RodZ